MLVPTYRMSSPTRDNATAENVATEMAVPVSADNMPGVLKPIGVATLVEAMKGQWAAELPVRHCENQTVPDRLGKGMQIKFEERKKTIGP
ncbi:MAG: hypothetical protein AAF982_08580 [Pseudomonadota bacterium]